MDFSEWAQHPGRAVGAVALLIVLIVPFILIARSRRFTKTGLKRLAEQNGWEYFSEEYPGELPYGGPGRRLVLKRTKSHPDAPRGDSYEYVTAGVRGVYRGRKFVARHIKLVADTGGNQQAVTGTGSIHVYVDTPVPPMAVRASIEEVLDAEDSDSVSRMSDRFKSWLVENWAKFGVLRGGDGVVSMESAFTTKKKFYFRLDFLCDVAEQLPVDR